MTDDQFCELLDFFKLSWRGYRKVRKGVKKRLVRHMAELQVKGFAEYLKLVKENPQVKKECQVLLAVSISRFFRDLKLWEVLENRVLPGIIQQERFVYVWSAGCACGDEVYSFRIVWSETLRKMPTEAGLKILATDMFAGYIERAKTGIFSMSSLKEVPDKIIKTYFRPFRNKTHWQIRENLKTGTIWMVHNLLDDPPDTGFDIIFLRNNLLTYYREPLKHEGLCRILGALKEGGFLIIGSHEKIPESQIDLVRTDLHPCIYRKGPLRKGDRCQE